MTAIKKNKEMLLTIGAFAIFIFVACFKLTAAPLWFDETIEYWYSTIMFGRLPYEGVDFVGPVNMYERIVSTFQPPIYNILMWLWLQVSDTEWWFRFFGVVMGFIGAIGIYKSVQKLSNTYVASLAVVFCAFLYRLVYFWQECAEYCIMLAALCWALYFWISLLKEVSTKNIILFTVFCIIPVYCQYGAAFPVFGMIVTAFLYVVLQKDKKYTKTIFASYGGALVFAALPLFWFFIRIQMSGQVGREETFDTELSAFGSNFITDFFGSMGEVFRWSFLAPGLGSAIVTVLLVFVLILVAIALIFGKSKTLRWMALFNLVTWVIYYVAVKLGVYSYGSFGSRYNMFFVPLWAIFIFAVCYELYQILGTGIRPGKLDLSKVQKVFAVLCVCAVAGYSMISWVTVLRHNWTKEDIRGAVNAWYEEEAYEKPTIIYYASNSGFAYYARQNEAFKPEHEDNVAYMTWMRDKTAADYEGYVNQVYGVEWPAEIYVVASHTRDDLDTFASCFTSRGYEQEEVYNIDDGMLLRFVLEESVSE